MEQKELERRGGVLENLGALRRSLAQWEMGLGTHWWWRGARCPVSLCFSRTDNNKNTAGGAGSLLSFAQLCSRPTLLVCKGLIDGQGLQAPGHLHPTLESDV